MGNEEPTQIRGGGPLTPRARSAIAEVRFAAGTKKLNGDTVQADEVHRIARGLLEADLDVPGLGVLTVRAGRQTRGRASSALSEQRYITYA